MRSFSGRQSLDRSAFGIFALALLASCVTTGGIATYPAHWPPVQGIQSKGSCPKIAGVYHDLGEYVSTATGRPCDRYSDDCESLIYALLYDAYMSVKGTGIGRKPVDIITIRQPSPGVLDIRSTPDGERGELSIAGGDFTCDEDGLRLKERSASLLLGVGNFVSYETRIFNAAVDGSLIMKSAYRTRGHTTIMFADNTGAAWVRWTPASDPATSGVGSASPKPDEYVNCVSNGRRQWTYLSKCD